MANVRYYSTNMDIYGYALINEVGERHGQAILNF